MTIRRIFMEIDVDESVSTQDVIGHLKQIIKNTACEASAQMFEAQYDADCDPDGELHPDAKHWEGISTIKCRSMIETCASMDMGPQEIHRFPSMKSANIVAGAMSCLTNAKVHVLHHPVSEEEQRRGVGNFVIMTYCRDGDPFSTHRMSNCCNAALTLALADALREKDPIHPLLGIWHLRPENRGKLSKYKPI